MTSYSEYSEILQSSVATAQSLFDKCRDLQTAQTVADDEAIEFLRLHKRLVRENVAIVKTKDTLKLKIDAQYSQLSDKRRSFNPVDDPRLRKLDSLVLQNSQVLTDYRDAVERFEKLDELTLDDAEEMQWLQSLGSTREEMLERIKHSLETDNTDNKSSEGVVERLQRAMDTERLKRFRLQFLNGHVYQRDKNAMVSLNSKWLQKVDRLTRFIEQDLREIMTDIDSGKQDFEKDGDVLAGRIEEEYEDEEEETPEPEEPEVVVEEEIVVEENAEEEKEVKDEEKDENLREEDPMEDIEPVVQDTEMVDEDEDILEE